MNTPEISQPATEELKLSDLETCSQTSKDWSHYFAPFACGSLDLRPQDDTLFLKEQVDGHTPTSSPSLNKSMTTTTLSPPATTVGEISVPLLFAATKIADAAELHSLQGYNDRTQVHADVSECLHSLFGDPCSQEPHSLLVRFLESAQTFLNWLLHEGLLDLSPMDSYLNPQDFNRSVVDPHFLPPPQNPTLEPMTIMTVHVDPENALLFQVMSTNLEGVEFPLLRIRYQPLGTTTASQGSSVWVAGLVNSPVQLNIPAGPSQEHSITSPLSQILVDGQLMRVMEMVFLSPSVTFQDRLAVKAMINQERIAGLRDTTVWMFELDSEPSRRGSLLPIANAIKHCGGLIENLAMRVPCPMFPELISATKNLKKLRVESSSMILPDNNKSGKGSDFYKIEQLLTNNPDIQQLDLEGFEGGPDVSRILQRLTRVCPHLQELRLRNLRFDFRALIVLLLHSPRLRTLTAQECGITGNTRGGPERKERFPATAPMFKTLEALNVRGIVGLSIMGLLDWAGQCPRLRTLTIARPSSSFDRKTFRFTALRRCTRLSKVVFDGKSLTDIELADMIVNCPQLTALSPFRGHFGIDSFSSLMFIFQNITTLELFDSHMNTAMIHMILFSCENLEVFTCDELNADIDLRTVTVERLLQDGKPLSPSSSSARDYHQGKEGYHSCKITSNRWICSGLRVFKVKTLIWSLDIARNLLLAEHIASLRRLEDFVLGQIAHSIRPEDDRDIAIYAEGMTEGLRLKKGVFDRVQLETDPDLEWMLVSWPKLRHFQRCA